MDAPDELGAAGRVSALDADRARPCPL